MASTHDSAIGPRPNARAQASVQFPAGGRAVTPHRESGDRTADVSVGFHKALAAARAVLDKHAEDVVVLDVGRLSTVADFFILATANSTPQLSAMAEEIEAQLRSRGGRVWHVEGLEASQPEAAERRDDFRWVLVDCGDVVIHLFTPTARTFYQLERLWGDAPHVPLDPLFPSSAGTGKP